jgi:hypothetical protein
MNEASDKKEVVSKKCCSPGSFVEEKVRSMRLRVQGTYDEDIRTLLLS